jgi:acyl-CoA synthetase (AMP-forming)/AMP-acid ligase II
MNISTLLNIVAETLPDRVAVQDEQARLTYDELERLSTKLAHLFRAAGHEAIAMLGTNSIAFPALFFAAAKAGVPFVPLNYRLTDAQLERQGKLLGRSLLVTDEAGIQRLGHLDNLTTVLRSALFDEASGAWSGPIVDTEETGAAACWLFTSGTTGEPKTAVLKHENLSSYIFGTIDPMSADEHDAVLASVPPYHIAGLAGVLSNIFAARRIVYLESFTPQAWVDAAVRESVTQAMVVPTMLQRILPILRETGQTLPKLRSLSYGGGRMPVDLIEEALTLLPSVGFTNAYGLTETSSSIALLGPEDHRVALASDDPAVKARLGSVGKPLPGIELQIRNEAGEVVPAGTRGEIWVRGPQVAGEYRGKGAMLVDGWFCTRDEGWLDQEGYLFLLGRVDDVIIRGGENISPGEIEDVIRTHPSVADVAVVAKPDEEWGEVPVAFIVPFPGTATVDEAEIQVLVRANLRSSRVPSRVVIVDELPHNETGKLLRNQLRERLKEIE